MRLKATCKLVMSAPAPAPIIAMLRPRSGDAQWVVSHAYDLKPFVQAIEYEDCFGNLCQRLTAPTGPFEIYTELVVEVADAIAVKPGATLTPVAALPANALQFLLPSRYCPADKLRSLAAEVVSGKLPGYDQVEAIRAWIRSNIEYKYGVSNESTDAVDTLNTKAGVCRDYSHIGMSLCRALRIPARMVVGYLYQLDPMDLHAWFEAFIDGQWYTFDATQESPRGGRVAIAYGRDAADVALITELAELKTDHIEVSVAQV